MLSNQTVCHPLQDTFNTAHIEVSMGVKHGSLQAWSQVEVNANRDRGCSY